MTKERVMLSYRQIGDSQSDMTLVFLHGSSMTKEGMMPLAEGFVQYNCIVFDLTAHGESGGTEPDEVKDFADDVEYSIEELQNRNVIGAKIVMLGYSMGGAITCEIAIRKKLPLAGMVVLSSGGDLSSYTPLLAELKSVPAEKFVVADVFPALVGADTSKEQKQAIIEHFDSTKVSDVISYGDLMASNRYNRLADCARIDIPALMVQGCDDTIVLPMAAVETWKMIPHSELLMIPYKGHAALFEDKELLWERILSFVEKL
ncbi:MAG: alpha/beta hydrolase [Lachnospiraceae bacterium]|nr:alpha/beta hydrolase [Lachnospiraceae bacterium]